jgi:hypothetical protein
MIYSQKFHEDLFFNFIFLDIRNKKLSVSENNITSVKLAMYYGNFLVIHVVGVQSWDKWKMVD